MKFEELEKATPEMLRESVKSHFDNIGRDKRIGNIMTAFQTQFYMAEMDRREAAIERKESRRIANRDFSMELIVIFLIALELIASAWGIFLAVRESKEQAQVMERLIRSMDAVEKSTRQAGQLNLVK